jgi:cell division septation protein DedD
MMLKRFALLPLLLVAAAACAHREVLPETTATPTYRREDLLEATAAITGHKGIDDRVAMLEAQMTAMKVELSRVSGATQRLEARALQTAGVVGPEPPSKAAMPLDKAMKRKAAKAKAPEAASPEPPADPRDPWAGGAAPAEPKAAQDQAAAGEPPKSEPAKDEPAKEQKVASAAPASVPAPAQEPGAVGFAVQLGAFGSAERASTGWEELKSQGGPLLADLLPKREEMSQGGKTLYRLKAGPLPDREAAAKRCAALQAQNMSCLVTLFSGDWPSS